MVSLVVNLSFLGSSDKKLLTTPKPNLIKDNIENTKNTV